MQVSFASMDNEARSLRQLRSCGKSRGASIALAGLRKDRLKRGQLGSRSPAKKRPREGPQPPATPLLGTMSGKSRRQLSEDYYQEEPALQAGLQCHQKVTSSGFDEPEELSGVKDHHQELAKTLELKDPGKPGAPRNELLVDGGGTDEAPIPQQQSPRSLACPRSDNSTEHAGSKVAGVTNPFASDCARRQPTDVLPDGTKPFEPNVMKRSLPSDVEGEMSDERPESHEVARRGRHYGLRNLGNTCYLNAVVQALSGVRCFTADTTDTLLRRAVDFNSTLQALSKLFLKMREEPADESPLSINPTTLRRNFTRKHKDFWGTSQQDAHEFLCALLDTLHEDVKAAAPELADELVKRKHQLLQEPLPESAVDYGDRPIDVLQAAGRIAHVLCPTCQNFSCTVRQEVECLQCGLRSSSLFEYHHFSLDIPDPQDPLQGTATFQTPNLQGIFDAYFQNEEFERACERCCGPHANVNEREDSSGGLENELLQQPLCRVRRCFVRLPRVLVLHLKRFGLQLKDGELAEGPGENSLEDNSVTAAGEKENNKGSLASSLAQTQDAPPKPPPVYSFVKKQDRIRILENLNLSAVCDFDTWGPFPMKAQEDTELGVEEVLHEATTGNSCAVCPPMPSTTATSSPHANGHPPPVQDTHEKSLSAPASDSGPPTRSASPEHQREPKRMGVVRPLHKMTILNDVTNVPSLMWDTSLGTSVKNQQKLPGFIPHRRGDLKWGSGAWTGQSIGAVSRQQDLSGEQQVSNLVGSKVQRREPRATGLLGGAAGSGALQADPRSGCVGAHALQHEQLQQVATASSTANVALGDPVDLEQTFPLVGASPRKLQGSRRGSYRDAVAANDSKVGQGATGKPTEKIGRRRSGTGSVIPGQKTLPDFMAKKHNVQASAATKDVKAVSSAVESASGNKQDMQGLDVLAKSSTLQPGKGLGSAFDFNEIDQPARQTTRSTSGNTVPGVIDEVALDDDGFDGEELMRAMEASKKDAEGQHICEERKTGWAGSGGSGEAGPDTQEERDLAEALKQSLLETEGCQPATPPKAGVVQAEQTTAHEDLLIALDDDSEYENTSGQEEDLVHEDCDVPSSRCVHAKDTSFTVQRTSCERLSGVGRRSSVPGDGFSDEKSCSSVSAGWKARTKKCGWVDGDKWGVISGPTECKKGRKQQKLAAETDGGIVPENPAPEQKVSQQPKKADVTEELAQDDRLGHPSAALFEAEEPVINLQDAPGDHPSGVAANGQISGGDSRVYCLQSVVHHKGGSAHSGHYVADVLDSDSSRWYHHDDSITSTVPKASVFDTSAESSAYLLFFVNQKLRC